MSAKKHGSQTAAKAGAAKAAPAKQPRSYCQQKLQAVDFTAPKGGVSEGRFYRIGGVILFAAVSAEAGRRFQAVTAGLFNEVPGIADGDFGEGDAVAFDADAGVFVAASDERPAAGFVGEGGARLHLTGQVA